MQKQFLLLCFILNLLVPAFSQKQVVLPNGWKLSPAGKSLPLGDLPLNIAVSNSKKMLAVTNNGQSKQSLQLIEVASQRVIDQVTIEKSWLGLKFSADEKYLYAAGGNDNRIWKYAIINKKLNVVDSFILGEKCVNSKSREELTSNSAHPMVLVEMSNPKILGAFLNFILI